MEITIRNAIKSDCNDLTEIAFKAKRYWNYPEEYYERWKQELTITDNYINTNYVRCCLINNQIIGFYSIVYNLQDQFFGEVFVECGYWLDHMFIIPQYHKMGIGLTFINELKMYLKDSLNNSSVYIFVDPNSVGFYNKMGAIFIRESNSSIPGRKIPIYKFQ